MNLLTKVCYLQCGVTKGMNLRAEEGEERLSIVKMHGLLV